MGIGLLELGLLIAVTLATVLAVWMTKRRRLIVYPLLFLIAVVVSPADIASTLLIALPNCIVFALAFRYLANDRVASVGPDAE